MLFNVCMKELQTREPGPHVENVRSELHELANHLRRDAEIVDDDQAQALFETTAEVLRGLERALEYYQRRTETLWQRAVDISG